MAVAITLFFISCQKDQPDPEVVFADNEVSMRSSQDACFNIINNPNFTQGTPSNEAIIADIDDWECFYGSTDLVDNSWNYGTAEPTYSGFWANYNFSDPIVYLCTGGSPAHGEGMTQQLEFSIGAGTTYCLTFDAGTTAWPDGNNGNLTLNVEFGSNLPVQCTNGSAVPVCTNPPSCFSYAIPINSEYPNLQSFTTSFVAPANAENIYFWTDTDLTWLTGARGTFLDNVELSCQSDQLLGFTAVQNGDCSFSFTPTLSSTAEVTEILWDFGDGNFSIEHEPTHSYATESEFLVTIRLIDGNGCCAEYEEEVSCVVDECNYICHEQVIGYFRCATAVEIVHPVTGIPTQFGFSTSYHVVDFQNVAIEIQNSLAIAGYNVTVDLLDPAGNISCHKNTVTSSGEIVPQGTTYGYFVSGDVEVIRLLGNDNWTEQNSCVSTDLSVVQVLGGGPFANCQ